MNKHNQIMNLPTDKMDASLHEVHTIVDEAVRDGLFPHTTRYLVQKMLVAAYKLGHRDARHAAADIVQGE